MVDELCVLQFTVICVLCRLENEEIVAVVERVFVVERCSGTCLVELLEVVSSSRDNSCDYTTFAFALRLLNEVFRRNFKTHAIQVAIVLISKGIRYPVIQSQLRPGTRLAASLLHLDIC